MFGFLSSSSATRLYRGRDTKLVSANFTCCHTLISRKLIKQMLRSMFLSSQGVSKDARQKAYRLGQWWSTLSVFIGLDNGLKAVNKLIFHVLRLTKGLPQARERISQAAQQSLWNINVLFFTTVS